MSLFARGDRVVTELDFVRLTKLGSSGMPDDLSDSLELAEQVPSPAVPADVVTMYSQIQILEDGTPQPRTLTLCYPDDAEPAHGFISVLSPVGASLLGLRVGARARWVTPQGDTRTARVLAILFQPEASGDYTT